MMRKARAVVSLAAAVLLASAAGARAQSPPPAPAHYFNDYAGVVAPDVATRLDRKLEAFDGQTSSQIVVAVFPELPSPSLEDFTVRAAQAWRVGRSKLSNGAVLFVFVKDRKMRIETGYGLEGALPDAICKRIIDETLKPAFRGGDFAGGLRAGVDAMIAATKGEYKGTGQTQAERRRKSPDRNIPWIPFLFFAVIVIQAIVRALRGTVFGRSGPYQPTIWTSGGGFSDGGGGFGGGSSGGDSGGFSGGGGDFGGGGAGGDW